MSRPLTNGELAAYRRCQRKWWLGYVRGLAKKGRAAAPASALQTGIDVHRGLQHHYGGGSRTESVEAAANPESALPEIMVDGYLDWLETDGADEGLEVDSVETTISASLRGRELWARADVRGRQGGRYLLIDHKTCTSVNEYDSRIGLLTQPLHYLAVERLGGAEPVEWAGSFAYNLLKRVKRTAKANPPFYRRLPVYHTDAELKSYLGRAVHQSDEMAEKERALAAKPVVGPKLAYPNPTRDCAWDCPFTAVCPMLDSDPAAAETVLEDAYEERDPLAHHAK